MPSSVRRVVTLAAFCGLALMLSGSALAQSYALSYLDSDLTGKAKHVDPLLKNGWGLAYAPGGAFWISDEASGYSTLSRKRKSAELESHHSDVVGYWHGLAYGHGL